MSDVKSEYRRIVAEALNKFINEKNAGCAPVNADTVAVQTPPNPEMGDLGIPMFVYAKTLRAAPSMWVYNNLLFLDKLRFILGEENVIMK